LAERPRPFWVAGAFIVGLSPACAQSLEQLMAEPRLWYVVATWVLFALAVRRADTDGTPNLLAALPWVGAAVIVQVLAWGGGFPAVSRLAVPLGVVGFLRGVLAKPLDVALLAVFCVPPPHFLTIWIGLDFAAMWAQLAAYVIPAAGEVARVTWDGGLRLLALGSGVVWYRNVFAERSWPQLALSLGLLVVPGAVLLQILGFGVAGLLPEAARLPWLIHGLWMAAFAAFLWAPLPGRRHHGPIHAV